MYMYIYIYIYEKKTPSKDGHKCSLGPECQISNLLVQSHVLNVVPFGLYFSVPKNSIGPAWPDIL